ncbi:MFS transporter [Streptomyces nojiriensis]|uniref:MFS transporter n=3 Tax=Streptomyces nojiriensis TaxID=66374 RepID=A0ABQ3SIR9_9ACTN|nr:MFS transporter [Streptomyces nojiriensis]QTI49651.1 Antiseptic resistance protein [Streptomyces nojiriensis]GGS24007.1 MFS transporter [Streptomyces nojiriensis]GHI68038.1 MFS transporter [Streptomyces nojiriensis]
MSSPLSPPMSPVVSTPPPARQRLILGVLVFAQLLIWLDGTILTTAFETLSDPVRGLGATPGELQWATGAYTLAFAGLMFTGGALGDRFGHRNVLLTGMALFGVASALAAYATTPGQLIAARAVMGAGAALLVPATMAVVSWTFEPAQRPAAFGTLSSFAGVGLAAGPILAGVLLARFWWGSVFLVNVPVVVLGLGFIARYVPNSRSPQVRRLDPAGLLLSTGGLGVLAYGLIRAGQDASFAEPRVWGSTLVGIALIAAFVVVELRIAHPSFDPRLLAQRRFAAGNLTLMTVFLAMTAASFYLAFYLQGVRGYSALDASLLALPGALGVVVGAPVAVRLARRTSVRLVCSIALTVAAVAMGSFALFGATTPIAWYAVAVLVQGTAIGMVIAPVTGAVLGSLPLERSGAGSAVNSTLRQTGSVLGIAAGGTITSIVYRRSIDGSLAGLPDPVREPARVSAELARHVAAATHDTRLAAAADSAFLHAMHVGALWTAGFTLIGAVVLAVGLRPEHPTGREREPVPEEKRAARATSATPS